MGGGRSERTSEEAQEAEVRTSTLAGGGTCGTPGNAGIHPVALSLEVNKAAAQIPRAPSAPASGGTSRRRDVPNPGTVQRQQGQIPHMEAHLLDERTVAPCRDSGISRHSDAGAEQHGAVWSKTTLPAGCSSDTVRMVLSWFWGVPCFMRVRVRV